MAGSSAFTPSVFQRWRRRENLLACLALLALAAAGEKALGLTAEVVRRPRRPRYVWVKEGEEIHWERIRKLLPEPGFKVLPRRWVVERTFSWIDQNRRMSKDYERLPESSEAFIYLAMTRLMVRRLARS